MVTVTHPFSDSYVCDSDWGIMLGIEGTKGVKQSNLVFVLMRGLQVSV